MFEELDVVRLTKDLPAEGLSAGQTGTVHMVHTDLHAHTTYLVEFSDDEGMMLALLSVNDEDLELHWSWKAHPEAH